LDGLHEDVNVVRQKPPAVDDPDSDGTNFTDKELAAISWNNYLRRTDSQVLRLFQGQFRSTVSCLTCGKVGQRCPRLPASARARVQLSTCTCASPSRGE